MNEAHLGIRVDVNGVKNPPPRHFDASSMRKRERGGRTSRVGLSLGKSIYYINT